MTNKVLYLVIIVMMAINLISSIILLLLLISVFIFVDWTATIVVVSMFGVMYYAITALTKHKLKRYSDLIGKLSTQQVKISQESSRGIREILVSNSQSIFISIFKACNFNLREAQARNHFYSLSPRYTVEAAGIILLVTLAYILIGILKNPSAFLILAAIAFSAQRLLPLMQQAYVAWATIKGNQNSLNDVLELIEKFSSESISKYHSEISKGEITFNHQIDIQNISFNYRGSTKNILNNVSINIVKGQFIGITGITGSGKSTFIDIFLGLLEPAKGKIFLDDKELLPSDKKEWRKKIAHVPQSIFIADSTIEENIAFGVIPDEVDHELVIRVAKIACLDDFIKNLPEGYRSRVGESGSTLSGGQKQRIGIARALYKRAEILVLDEATSALDSVTEEMVMNSLLQNQDNLTIISIAHRLSTLKKANKVVNLNNGNLYEVIN
jgi:ATP-binding cassette subfamily B protein